MRQIILCKPNIEALIYANDNYQSYLFREPVNVYRVCEQHKYLKKILLEQKQTIFDIHTLLPNNLSIDQCTNMIFMRDVFIHTKKGLVLGKMKEKVRQSETENIATSIEKQSINFIYKVTGQEVLEGGDFFCHQDISYVAIGTRTNLKAVKKLMELDLYGTDTVAIIYTKNPDTNMHRIHLDCYFSPFRYKQCVLWEELIRIGSPYDRYVMEYKKDKNGVYIETFQHKRLYEYLIDHQYEVIPLSDESHYNYGCNLLELPNGVILVQDEESHNKIKESIYIPLDEIHKMYGGIHCVTNTIV